jgi:hypothetical protein
MHPGTSCSFCIAESAKTWPMFSPERCDGAWNDNVFLNSEAILRSAIRAVTNHCHLSGTGSKLIAGESGHKTAIAKFYAANADRRLIEGEMRRVMVATLCVGFTTTYTAPRIATAPSP